MRHPTEHDTVNGKRYKVRFRQGGTQTSETFRRKADADTFAAILDGGGVTDALEWLAARDRKASAVTFGDFFETYVAQLTGVTKGTRAEYLAIRRRYLTEWDDLPPPLLTRNHVTTLVNRLDDEGKSPKTIKNVVHMVSSCLALAMDEGHVGRNPCRRVRLPKANIDGHEARFLTGDEVGVLVDSLPDYYRALVIFLIGTGMRWSEATALQTRHVDLDNGTMAVRQAWKRLPGGFELGPPKSPKSRRTVNPAVMALNAVEPLLGKPNDFVFTTPLGNVVRHANFYNRIWVPACGKAGFDPRPRPHDCRHTHASWLISEGAPLEAVQDQLGHESIETTRSIYGHLLPAVGVALGKSASAAMDRALPDGMNGLRLAIETGGGADE